MGASEIASCLGISRDHVNYVLTTERTLQANRDSQKDVEWAWLDRRIEEETRPCKVWFDPGVIATAREESLA